MRSILVLIAMLVALAAPIAVRGAESFEEDLIISPLRAPGHFLAQFKFEVTLDDFKPSTNDGVVHANLLPLPILKLFGLSQFSVSLDELRLRFTQGRYQFSMWDQPAALAQSEFSSPSGVEFWSEFARGSNVTEVDLAWANMKQIIGGVFSINFGKPSERLATPSVLPKTAAEGRGAGRGEVRYELHPRENPCTENLTPWLKLAPCNAAKGIGALLAKSPALYDTQFHAMDLRVVKSGSKLTLSQKLTLVFAAKETQADLATFFRVPSVSSCPLASSSRLHLVKGAVNGATSTIEANTESSVALVSPSPFPESLTYNLKKLAQPLTLSMKFPKQDFLGPAEVPFLANAYILGHGQQDGELVYNFANNKAKVANVTLFFSSPWPVRFYFHALKATLTAANEKTAEKDVKLRIVSLIPSHDRGRPAQLEAQFEVPPQKELVLSVPFDRMFLHFAEHPPDPHRGYDIGPSMVEVKFVDEPTLLYYTLGHSIMLPTPDFSMMYNVITLTCTVVAMFYGQVLNLMVRRLGESYRNGEFASNRPLNRLFRNLLGRFFQKKDETKPDNVDATSEEKKDEEGDNAPPEKKEAEEEGEKNE